MSFITLFSDFGLQDSSVGIAKGILMQHVPLNKIIDITHQVQPFNLQQAAYLFGAAYRNFPLGSCHLLLFDVYASKTPKLVLSEYKGHFFLTPDNSLLPAALNDDAERSWLCLEMQNDHSFHDWLHKAGEIIQQLSINGVSSVTMPEYRLPAFKPRIHALPYSETHNVIHIDDFENVVIDFTEDMYDRLSAGKQFLLKFTQVEELNEVKQNYSDVREGYKLCRFNSNGYLEICINHGKAASLFGLKLGGKNNNITISFT